MWDHVIINAFKRKQEKNILHQQLEYLLKEKLLDYAKDSMEQVYCEFVLAKVILEINTY